MFFSLEQLFKAWAHRRLEYHEQRLANEVKPSLEDGAFRRRECAAFRGLVTLMIMVLGEAPKD